MIKRKIVFSMIALSFFSSGGVQAEKRIENRWFSNEQVAQGNVLFQANCAVCHKADASGTKNWKDVDANNKYPPPPLNGTAHTWHHSLSGLARTIKNGGIRLGGTMPGFSDKLNDQQVLSILAWVQNQWSDEVYSVWAKRHAPK